MTNSLGTENKLTFEADIMPELELLDDSGDVTIVIKHDYFGSDNDHGRELFTSFISSIMDEFFHIDRVILIDSGVKCLNEDHALNGTIRSIESFAGSLIACSESLSFYGVTCPQDITSLDAATVFQIIIASGRTIMIE